MGRDNIAPSREELDQHIADFKDADIESVAVVFVHSYQNPAHEKDVVAWLREALPGKFICASHEVLAEFREYERTSTTVLNAALGPVMSRYLDQLERRVSFGLGATATSSSRTEALLAAGSRPSADLHAGIRPRRGRDRRRRSPAAAPIPDLITFDVGGTSTDVCLIEDSCR